MSQHTPAPWDTYPPATKTWKEARANQKLAIASPKLLAAAKLVNANIDAWRNGGTPDYRTMMDAQDVLREAIAEAETP